MSRIKVGSEGYKARVGNWDKSQELRLRTKVESRKSKLGVENWSWEWELGVEVGSGSQESTLGAGVGNPTKEWESRIQVRSGSRESKSWTWVPRFSCKLEVGNWEPKMTPEFKNAISMQASCLGHRKYCKEVWFVHGASWTNCIKG
jgi:hypothetical protein